MEIFFTNILLGLAIALPVGTITVEMIKQGLKNGFFHGWSVGIGGLTIDILLILGLYLGLASFLAQPVIQSVMWLIGSGFLFYVGYDSIKNANEDITLDGEKPTKSLVTSYKNGLLVAVSPGNLVFWISIFGTVLSHSFDSTNQYQFLLVGIGILVGIILHDIGLLVIVATTRKAINQQTIILTSKLAGFVLIGFGLSFLYRFFESFL